LKKLLVLLLIIGFGVVTQADDTLYYPADTWRTATFTEVGMDESLVLEGITEFIDQYEQVNSILIIKDGYLVLENYYNDTDAYTINNVFSVTKSLTSVLIGMAIDDGIIPDLDVTLGEALPQYFADGAFPDKADITLRDLLMMRSGIGWVEVFQAVDHIRGDEDEVLSVLENPMVARPSVFWNYSTGTSHLISAVFQAYADMPLEDYAHARLFEPLGINNWEWREDITGTNFGGSEFYTTPLNLARFGYLILRDGVWDDEQVLSSDWIALTTTTLADNTDEYAYHWWVNNYDAVEVFSAQGFGGQIIMGVPDYDLLVVMIIEPDFGAPSNDDELSLLQSHILLAINRTDG